MTKFEAKPAEGKVAGTEWTFAEKELIWTRNGEERFRGTYQLDLSENPKRMVIKLEGEPGSGKAIFRVRGDVLVVKINDVGDKGFATSFEPESHYDVYELKRK